MAAIVAVIAIAFFVKDLYENSKIHTALTVMVIDSYGTKQEEAEEKVQEALGIQDDPYEIVTVDESLRTGEDGVALESYSQMAFTTKVSARAVDVLIGSEDYMDGFGIFVEILYKKGYGDHRHNGCHLWLIIGPDILKLSLPAHTGKLHFLKFTLLFLRQIGLVFVTDVVLINFLRFFLIFVF